MSLMALLRGNFHIISRHKINYSLLHLPNRWCHHLAISQKTFTYDTGSCSFKILTPSKKSTILIYSKNSDLTCYRRFSAQGLRDGLMYYTSPNFPPIAFARDFLECIHDHTGMPWWLTIVMTTFLVKTVITLPLAILAAQNEARLQLLEQEISSKMTLLHQEVRHAQKVYNWTDLAAKTQFINNMRRIRRELRIRDNCHPAKNFLAGYFQLPIWVTLSLMLRNMSGSVAFLGQGQVCRPDLATGGTLWFDNLLVPDPYFALPIAMLLCNVSSVEVSYLRRPNPSTFSRVVTNVIRVANFYLLYIGTIMPSFVTLYWCTSSAYGLAQNLLLMTPAVRRVFQIPIAPAESANPFRDICAQAKLRYTWKKSGVSSIAEKTPKTRDSNKRTS